MTLKSGLLNHRVKRETGFGACTSWVGPSSGCFATSVDMAATSCSEAALFFYGSVKLGQSGELKNSIMCLI